MILDEIAQYALIRVNESKKRISMDEIIQTADKLPVNNDFPFKKALSGNDISFICEVKKASPSKGIIAADFPYLQIAKDYEKAGASAISVLTEPKYFMGNDNYLKEIASKVNIPVLRKDFTVDSYQIYEAKILGASAILLICAILSDEQLKDYINIAHSLGLSALVEAHDETEVKRAIYAGAGIIGVNNRNLKDFTVDINNSIRLRELVPKNIIFVSESGIKTSQDIKNLKNNKTNAVLIGETFMRNPDKTKALNYLKGLE